MNQQHLCVETINNLFFETFKQLTLTASQSVRADKLLFCVCSSRGLSRLQRDKDFVVRLGVDSISSTNSPLEASHGVSFQPQDFSFEESLGIRDITPKRRLE